MKTKSEENLGLSSFQTNRCVEREFYIIINHESIVAYIGFHNLPLLPLYNNVPMMYQYICSAPMYLHQMLYR